MTRWFPTRKLWLEGLPEPDIPLLVHICAEMRVSSTHVRHPIRELGVSLPYAAADVSQHSLESDCLCPPRYHEQPLHSGKSFGSQLYPLGDGVTASTSIRDLRRLRKCASRGQIDELSAAKTQPLSIPLPTKPPFTPYPSSPSFQSPKYPSRIPLFLTAHTPRTSSHPLPQSRALINKPDKQIPASYHFPKT